MTSTEKASPSFEREYNLKYLGLIGNVFHTKDIEMAVEKGMKYDPDAINVYSRKSLGIDPGFGSSKRGVVVRSAAELGWIRDILSNPKAAELAERMDKVNPQKKEPSTRTSADIFEI
jgi:hypothetical protein